ncbi:LacI family DNA-binding transcriptional regulator [Companilactobacillus allii]|uniref:LacI family transcriptional regulator n=1 Tax=Companilactobacillus allii TaxID=1847728 RepID=A0A1P8Q0V0_9LACO|nr:LacI family DNA-binding transcriptional regulator [Companilactobacillus allii]APX71502.1 LacI family transcriptional regulator [Companilactobacillus allii]USQ68583.1 LacI family DNA-binding transcriptional regulator [Companilactobacillus allii]
MVVKIDDVARLAGVSKTTVSRVLNNRGYLSDATIKKVHEAMESLNYQPNAVARQLFKKETKLVGLIFPTVDNPFFGQLVAALEKRLFDAGFKVLIGNSMNDPKKEETYLKELISNQVDGLIVGAQNRGIEEYHNTNLPVVAIDRVMNEDIPVIASDNYMGGKLATELLINSGAKNIINTDGPVNLETPAHRRREAYEDVMKEHRLVPHTHIVDFSWDIEKKRSAVEEMFVEYPEVDGVFATNDMDAALIWQVATSLGCQIPKDLKIVGYDGANSTRILLPELTTIEQPVEQMAKVAVKTLVSRIKGDRNIPLEQIIPVKVWNGKSV